MDFDERKLRALVAIADTGSLGRAAEAMHVSQPALSRMISELEARLEARLFERHPKGMLLTDAGKVLVKHARQLTFDFGQARHALHELQGLRSGHVRIGAVAAATRTIVPQAVVALRRQAPGLTIELVEAPDSELIDALLERRIDLIVASDSTHHPDIEPLDHYGYEDIFQVCCRASEPPVPRNAGLSEVLSREWVMLKQGRTPRLRFEELAAANGYPIPRITVETNTIGTQISILRHSDLLGWLPRAVIADQVEAGILQVIEIRELAQARRFRAFRRRNGYFAQHTELFYQCLLG